MSHSGFPELMAHLECPVCLDTFSGRVLQCKNGHNICAEHAPKLRKKCPVCRTSYGRYSCRNLLAENLAALQTKNWIDQENPRVQDRRRFWDAHPAMDRNVTNNDDESSRVGDSSSNDESSSGDESSESDESFAGDEFLARRDNCQVFFFLVLPVIVECLTGKIFKLKHFIRVYIDTLTTLISIVFKIFPSFIWSTVRLGIAHAPYSGWFRGVAIMKIFAQ
ncbi:uncharacterized protein LOC118438601 [Folsomia candida]|uniref:uncharacterized protein LOC118438601 n=1 Tax=Folsomia candida TaxID=158441 RepID=UPI0016054803|nr:uncharacterized protein LOC118438601 [Folsomia candida]